MDKKTILALLDWFYHNDRNHQDRAHKLHWRKIKSSQAPWVVLVSEVMLQQTTVATIAKKFPIFIAQFPSAEAMVMAGIDKVLDAWAGLGYYRRAHNLFAAATVVANEWRGQWPQTFVAIKQLPGVGDYTARAIAALAFQQKTIPLDGNIIRVLSRWLKKDLSQNRLPRIKQIVARLDEMVLPDKNLPKNFMMSDWVQAMMDLANLVCKVEKPLCNICPLRNTCLGKKYWQDYPQPKIKKTKPIFYGAVLIGQNDKGEVLLERRPIAPRTPRARQDINHQGLYQGLLAFPMTDLVQDKKELMLAISKKLATKKITIKEHCVVHDLTHRRLVLSLVFYNLASRMTNHGQWVANGELASLPLPSVMKKVIKQVAK